MLIAVAALALTAPAASAQRLPAEPQAPPSAGRRGLRRIPHRSAARDRRRCRRRGRGLRAGRTARPPGGGNPRHARRALCAPEPAAPMRSPPASGPSRPIPTVPKRTGSWATCTRGWPTRRRVRRSGPSTSAESDGEPGAGEPECPSWRAADARPPVSVEPRVRQGRRAARADRARRARRDGGRRAAGAGVPGDGPPGRRRRAAREIGGGLAGALQHARPRLRELRPMERCGEGVRRGRGGSAAEPAAAVAVGHGAPELRRPCPARAPCWRRGRPARRGIRGPSTC